MSKVSEVSFEKVIPTAWGVAFRRTLTSIPLCQEIFSILDKSLTDLADRTKLEQLKRPKLTPFFEARYLLTQKLLRENRTNQFLELASGLCPRGILLTENAHITYVEIDFPSTIEQKTKIIEELVSLRKIDRRPNLRLLAGNVLDPDIIDLAANFFQQAPITIINEGLMRYQWFDNKALVGKNNLRLLRRFGGTWITPDITLPEQNTIRKAVIRQTMELTGIDVSENAFPDAAHAKSFFETLGFEVEQRSFMEVVDQLTSPKKLGMTDSDVEQMISWRVAFVMKNRESDYAFTK
ncbi:MAG: class I SAM-dependent methyltransferase [Deltaproteobacteria bacterium]|nr:class I SAM-dependent methyltransferase [Deltaproteobacteria bacterium]